MNRHNYFDQLFNREERKFTKEEAERVSAQLNRRVERLLKRTVQQCDSAATRTVEENRSPRSSCGEE
jgi:hypothetical protein